VTHISSWSNKFTPVNVRSTGRIATKTLLVAVATVPYMAGIMSYVYPKSKDCFTDDKSVYNAVSKVIFSTQLIVIPVAKDINDNTSGSGML
jgi:hypothetical protein